MQQKTAFLVSVLVSHSRRKRLKLFVGLSVISSVLKTWLQEMFKDTARIPQSRFQKQSTCTARVCSCRWSVSRHTNPACSSCTVTTRRLHMRPRNRVCRCNSEHNLATRINSYYKVFLCIYLSLVEWLVLSKLSTQIQHGFMLLVV